MNSLLKDLKTIFLLKEIYNNKSQLMRFFLLIFSSINIFIRYISFSEGKIFPINLSNLSKYELFNYSESL